MAIPILVQIIDLVPSICFGRRLGREYLSFFEIDFRVVSIVMLTVMQLSEDLGPNLSKTRRTSKNGHSLYQIEYRRFRVKL